MKIFYLIVAIATFGVLAVTAQTALQIEVDEGFPLHSTSGVINNGLNNGGAAIGPLDDQTKAWRLPREVIPSEYTLTITPILVDNVTAELGAMFDAPGAVEIIVKAVKAVKTITLHSKDISITTAEVTKEGDPTPLTMSQDPTEGPHSFYTFHLVDDLVVNDNYVIKFTYRATVKDGLDGLYRSSYMDPETNTLKYIATTQMEALHARQMFPCFDEPALKAKFNIKIGRIDGHISLSTTKIINTTEMVGVEGWSWDEFEPTIAMPTYLLAIIVSEFTFADAPEGLFPKQVRTYAPKHYIDRDGGTYAADRAAKLLKYFQDYYIEEYPMSKMDSAAVPDFFFGAMENYGLNIYRETALLYFPDESTEAERFTITRILAHELAHQWFGNLVSPAWWTHIWLNEGFATYVAAQGANVNEIGAEFEPWERFQNDAVQNSMGFDARSDYSHSVKIDEETWSTRPEMDWFDRMAYEKAGSLILMMKSFLTEEVMKAGLQKYLSDKKFDAAIQDDLFQHLTDVAHPAGKIPLGLTMKQIMDSWTLQPGFPLIRVSVASPTHVYISQERFINNFAETQNHVNQNTGLWYVPMSIARQSTPSPTIQWMYNNVAMQSFQADTSQWIVVNAGADGFYRVIYDNHLLQKIKQQLEIDHTFITPRTRSQLLDDHFSAAWQKYMNIETVLDLASYLGNEGEIVVWNSVLNNLRKPFNLLSGGGSFYTSLRSFLLPRLESAISLSGGIGQQLPEQMGGMPVIRHLQFLDWLCALEHSECISFASGLVSEWMTQPTNNTIRRDIKPVVYCSAVANGNDQIFDFIKSQYMGVGITAKQRVSLLNGLGCSKDPSKINALLEGLLADGYYTQNSDANLILQAIAKTQIGRSQIFRFLRLGTNTQSMIAKYGMAGTTYIRSMITTCATYVSTATERDDIRAYGQDFSIIGNIDAALSTMQGNINWVAEFGAQISSGVQSLI